nr:HK97 family phage prohead protease [Actinomycetota bacterium]
MSATHTAPEQRTVAVDVGSLDTRGRTVVGYASVYNVLSEDLGGYREKIAPGAFADVLDSDVRALLNHDPNEVLGRTKAGTLRLFDEQRGLRFELDLPASPLGENVREAVRRGDLDGASFRFVVGQEEWDADVRTVTKVRELHDVTVATYGAYPAASVELRTRIPKEEQTMEPEVKANEEVEERTEQPVDPRPRSTSTGG